MCIDGKTNNTPTIPYLSSGSVEELPVVQADMFFRERHMRIGKTWQTPQVYLLSALLANFNLLPHFPFICPIFAIGEFYFSSFFFSFSRVLELLLLLFIRKSGRT